MNGQRTVSLLAAAHIVLVSAILTAPGANAQPGIAAVDKATATWARVRTASGTIEQTVINPLMGASATTHATFQQERPNKLAVRFTDAKGDAIVSDGQWLWIYLPSGAPGQVIRRSARDQSELPVDPGQFLESPRTRFDIVDKGAATIGDRATRAVLLTPKKGTPVWFARATVWIDDADGSIRQLEAVDESGITRRIRFLTLVTNATVDPAAFKFTVPKGVKIVNGS